MRIFHIAKNRENLSKYPFMFYCLPLGFLLFADATMSYYFPIAVQNTLNSNSLLGIVMAFSSVVGLFCDLIFPQLFAKRNWKFFILSAVLLSFLFPVFANLGVAYGSILLFLFASMFWGIYFEMMSFSQQNIIVDVEKKINFSRDWSIISMVWGFGLVIAPIVGSELIKLRLSLSTGVVIFFQITALVLILSLLNVPRKNKNHNEIEPQKRLNILKEFKYINILSSRIWYLVIFTIVLSISNATFWTIGGLFGKEIFGGQGVDWVAICLFTLPSIIAAFLFVRLNIIRRKKRSSFLFFLLSGLSLSLIILFRSNPSLILICIFLTGFFQGLAWILNGANFSELETRSGKNELHIGAINRMSVSTGFIIGPLCAGFFADRFGYLGTFVLLGILIILVSIFLIIVTPKKLKLPQHRLNELEHSLL